jgi:hypothetical protein
MKVLCLHMCARAFILLLSMQPCLSLEYGPMSCDVINFTVSGSLSPATPWQIADVDAFDRWDVAARIVVQPSLQLYSKRGFLRFAIETMSPEGLRYECANATLNNESLEAMVSAGVGQDCTNAGKLMLWSEYHAASPGTLDTLFERGLFPIKIEVEVCYQAVLPPPPLCTMGIPTGPGVLHDCNDVRGNSTCTAHCNSSTHSGASKTYQCSAEGRLLPMLDDVQCDLLPIALTVNLSQATQQTVSLVNDDFYFWLRIVLPIGCALLPLVVSLVQHHTGNVPWPFWLYHHFRLQKDPLPELMEDWSQMQQRCLSKYYEKCVGCSSRAPHWVLRTHLPADYAAVHKCKLCKDVFALGCDIFPPPPGAGVGAMV